MQHTVVHTHINIIANSINIHAAHAKLRNEPDYRERETITITGNVVKKRAGNLSIPETADTDTVSLELQHTLTRYIILFAVG